MRRAMRKTKRLMSYLLTIAMIVSLFVGIDMGWNVEEAKAATTYTIRYVCNNNTASGFRPSTLDKYRVFMGTEEAKNAVAGDKITFVAPDNEDIAIYFNNTTKYDYVSRNNSKEYTIPSGKEVAYFTDSNHSVNAIVIMLRDHVHSYVGRTCESGGTCACGVTADPLGHSYGTPLYTWSADGQTCTATRTCANDSNHTITESATMSSEVKIAATCTAVGTTTYTANFTVSPFETQTNDVQDIPALGHDFRYSVSGHVLTATCNNDASHTASLTLSTPATQIYSETPVEPTITYGTGDEQSTWTGAGVVLPGVTEAPTIGKHYYNAGSDGAKTGDEIGTIPVSVGKYVVVVNISYGEGTGKKASIDLSYEIVKASQETPTLDKFTVTSTSDKVTVVKKNPDTDTNNYEYSLDGTNWFDSGEFTGLSETTEHTIKVRIKETPTHAASASLEIKKYTLPKTPTDASEGVTVNNEEEKITIEEGYEVSTSPDFEPENVVNNGDEITPNTPYYVRKKGNGEHYGPSGAVPFTTPERATTPATPVVESKTDTSIKIAVVDGVEYSIDGGATWNTTGEFTGLTPNTEVTIKARVKATTDKFASEIVTLDVTTKNVAPSAPTEDTFTVTSTDGGVTINKADESDTTVYEYSIDNGETWITSGEFTGLDPATKYDILVRIKETDDTMPSASLTISKYTKAKTPTNAGDGVTVNNEEEKITVAEGYEVSTSPDFEEGTFVNNGDGIKPNTTYYVRKKGEEGKYEPSKAVPFTTPERATKPATPVVGGKTDTSIKITPVEGVEYSIDGGETWITTGEFTGLTADTEYTVKARVKATEGKFASEEISFTVKTKASSPVAPTGLKEEKPSYIGNNDGKITGVDSTMEYSTDGGETWVSVTGTEITGLVAGDVQVRVKETDTAVAGTSIKITVPVATEKAPAPAAPTGLVVVSPTTAGGHDGKVIGVDESMEYSVDKQVNWNDVEGNEITGLSAGDIAIRVKETETTKAGTPIVLSVKDGTVSVSEDNQKGNFESGGIKNTVEEVKAAVLTKEDQAAIKDGKDIQVWVEVKDHTVTVTKEDKSKVESKLEKAFTVGTYLDVTLWKQIAGEDANKITNVPNGKVKIGFTIPKDLQKANRTYKIIRVHDGVAEIIDATVDENFALTFETDRFSTYALVYTDADKAETETTAAKTGDTAPIALYVLMMGLAGLGIIVSKKRKTVR